MAKLEIEGIPIRYDGGEDWQQFYFSLPDLCRGFEGETKDLISNWIRTRSTLNFMAEWEKKYNDNFRVVEFDNQFAIKHGLDQEERFQVLQNEAEHQFDFLVPRALNKGTSSRPLFPLSFVARRSGSYGYLLSSRLAQRENSRPNIPPYLIPKALAKYLDKGN